MQVRRIIQVFSAILLNSSFLFEVKQVCLPVLNCHSCPLAAFACPIGMLGQFSALHLVPWLGVGLLLLAGALVGRLFCGWCCPFGLLQDLLYKIPFPRLRIPRHFEKLKYLILFGLVLMVPFLWGTTSPLFFCRVCPPATLQSAIPWAIIQGGFADFRGTIIRFTVFFIVIAAVLASQRAFCRVLCPLGALMGLCHKFSLVSLTQKPDRCRQCNICEASCSMEIKAGDQPKRSAECILCLECTKHCPASRKIGIRLTR